MFPEWETRLYHCSLPHYPLQGTFLRFVVLVISVHCVPNVHCVTTNVHCVGVHHVVINVHHVVSALIVATNFHHVDSVHHFLLFFIMLVLILLLLMFIMLCCCSSCCYKCLCCLNSLSLLIFLHTTIVVHCVIVGTHHVGSPLFMVGIIPTFILSYKLKLSWRWMVVGCLWL